MESSFYADLGLFRDAIYIFMLEEGRLPKDSSTGRLDDEMKPYISVAKFEQPTPIGGLWDIEGGAGGLARGGVGVDGHILDNSAILSMDRRYDDGRLDSGNLQALESDRYYWVIDEKED